MRVLALIAVLLTPLSASAVSFVYDGGPIGTFPDAGPLAFPKAQNAAQPSIPNNKQFFSDDANAFWTDLLDVRSAITAGYYHGLVSVSSAPPAPSSGLRFFVLNGVPSIENSTGAVYKIFTSADGGVPCPLNVVDSSGVIVSTTDCVGNLTINTDLQVVGATSLFGTAHLITDLAVDGVTVLGGTLEVDGAATFGSTLAVTHKATLDNGYVPGEWDVDGGVRIHGALARTVGRTSWSGFVANNSSPQNAFHGTAREAGTMVGCTWTGWSGDPAATGSMTFSIVDEDNAAATLCSGAIPCNTDGGPGTNWGAVACTGALVSGHHYLGGSSTSCSVRPSINYTCDLTYP